MAWKNVALWCDPICSGLDLIIPNDELDIKRQDPLDEDMKSIKRGLVSDEWLFPYVFSKDGLIILD